MTTLNRNLDLAGIHETDVDFKEEEVSISLRGSVPIISFSDDLENHLAKK